MISLDLWEHRLELVGIAKWVFDQVTSLPKDIRPDDRDRGGLYFILRVIGGPGMNQIIIDQAYDPHEATKFFAMEKATRAELNHDFSSQNTADKSLSRYAGCVAIKAGDVIIQASNSGLKAPEDVLSSVLQLSYISNMTVNEVMEDINRNGGELPDEFWDDSYLYDIIKSLRDIRFSPQVITA